MVPASTAVSAGCIEAAMPASNAKHITASMPLPLDVPSTAPTISWTGFSGNRSTSVCPSDLAAAALVTFSPARAEYFSVSTARVSADKDLPGCRIFTSSVPIITADSDRIAVKNSVVSPMRPSLRKSPTSTTARNSAETTSGNTTICIMRRNMRPTGSVNPMTDSTNSRPLSPRVCTAWATSPSRIPTARPTRIFR